jgi:DNA invertase Pin-like site-specific DNA recombinase
MHSSDDAISVVGSLRLSTASQVSDGDGLGVQRERIASWCAYQGLPEPRLEQDAGISGASAENRPALARALRLAFEAGRRAVLVVYKLDRLGRNAIDVQEVLAALLDSGVRVVSLGAGIHSASSMGSAMLKLLVSVLATFAELEKDTIRTRLLEGRRRADAMDRTYAVEPRYGRRVATQGSKELVADEGEAYALRRILALRGEGRSYRAICDALEREGVRPRRAARWSPTVVMRIATGKRPARVTKTTSARTARVRAEILQGAAAAEAS